MKKRTLGLIICMAVLLCVVITAAIAWKMVLSPLTPLQLFKIAISSEDIGRDYITIARNALKREPASTVITVNGVEHEFSLPNGATPYDNGRVDGYVICIDELQPYFDRLPSYGYLLVEQEGSFYRYKNDDLGIRMMISRQQYPGSLCLFYFIIGG